MWAPLFQALLNNKTPSLLLQSHMLATSSLWLTAFAICVSGLYRHVCMYVVYYTFCIIMMLCQDDKIECGLAEIIKAANKKRKKAVVSLLSATSRWSELGM